jgi:hypothetical protein
MRDVRPDSPSGRVGAQMNNPKIGFRSFLEKAENDGWIASYRWITGDSWGLLKNKLNGPAAEGFSRSHKKFTDGQWWAVEVEAHDGTVVGIDLELLLSRPILDKPDWITRRLALSKAGTPQKIIEEWSSREAAFKALAPDNSKLLLSQLRWTAPNTLGVFSTAGERLVQIRSFWYGKWCLCLGWRSA